MRYVDIAFYGCGTLVLLANGALVSVHLMPWLTDGLPVPALVGYWFIWLMAWGGVFTMYAMSLADTLRRRK